MAEAGALIAESVAAAARLVQAGDADRFAATMASPVRTRAPLWPIYAANLEIARAPWASDEPLVAEMRLQWWIDALEALASRGAPPAHVIGAALALRPAAAARLVVAAEARRRDCWREPFPDASALWRYLEDTSGVVCAAAGAALDATEDEIVALADLGAASGLAAFLMAAPSLAARGAPGTPDAGDEAVRALALQGLARSRDARRRLRGAGEGARAAARSTWRAEDVLRRAAAQPSSVRRGTVGGSEFSRRLGLLLATWRG